jgi:hypothetical protein
MPARRRSRWYLSARLVALAAGVAALAGLIFLTPPAQEAHGAAPAPQTTAGFQTTEKVVLHVELTAPGKGPLAVELIGPDGKVLARGERPVTPADGTSHRFQFDPLKVPADRVTVRCRFGDRPVRASEVALGKVLLVKAHETTLVGSRELYAGTEAAFRCAVHGVKSATETVPLPGSRVTFHLRSSAPGAPSKDVSLYEGKVGADGSAEVRFRVPEVPAGAYKLVVKTQSALGEEALEREVRVLSTLKVLLTTDKPLYQPGQLMHLRALALRPFDLQPVAKADLTLEVEDAKGNKVFKRQLKTSEHGIAAADFQLADEVNTGDFRVRALLGAHQADKTVTVKPYVLPKFKTALKADKTFYLPKEVLRGELQVDYFFGKPVAGAKVKVTASTFDVAFKDFLTFKGKTDAQGHVKFDVKLPDYFVGLPPQKGNALVRLEAEVTDTADHTEKVGRTFPVSDQAIRVSLIPEAGRLVPGLENKVFAAALYPDGSPAKCEVKVWAGREAKGKALATLKTNDAGLAELTLTPRPEQFRQGAWGQRPIETLGGTTAGWAPANLFDLTAEARDTTGNVARTTTELSSEPFGENVLLRLNKAIYKGGEKVEVEVRSSAGLPTVYLDVIKSGQVLLTRWLDVRDGKASYALNLPAAVFGTLEVHAYQMLGSGEIIRDSRVVYVSPANDLRVSVKADKDVYLPGAEGTIRFEVTDAQGRPAPAALGVLIVDEAVYALQEMQPGLEKVYFTLQEELLKPRAQVVYRPGENLDTLIRRPRLPDDRQQVAQVLLTAVRPKPPTAWHVNPAQERQQKLQAQIQQIGWGLYQYALNVNKPIVEAGKKPGTWALRADVVREAVKAGNLHASQVNDPVGVPLTPAALERLEPGFSANRLARAVTLARLQQTISFLSAYAYNHRGVLLKDGKWSFPDTIVADLAKQPGVGERWVTDGWGRQMKLVRRAGWKGPVGVDVHGGYALISAGPDGKFGTDDDVAYQHVDVWAGQWWHPEGSRQVAQHGPRRGGRGDLWLFFGPGGRGGRAPGMPGGPVPTAGRPTALLMELERATKSKASTGGDDKGPAKTDAGGPAAGPTRLREYFPETLLWRPELITDGRGRAELRVPFADSITTWRLTASASSRAGSLGGVSAPLRVFQDFFVDLDLPLALTQNDEVAFPVAVYNYLKGPQTVTLDLQPQPWFELVDGLGARRKVELKANQVTSVQFRIKAKKVGRFALTVKAAGSKMSDAVKRSIDVAPDGRKVEQVVTDRLKGKVTQALTIPESAIPDASRLLVKVYPGVFSQLLEGTEGMLRLPNGCFEQTSSSAYPNILVADYMKRTRTGSPATLMKAEQFLNVGYQRLLTFERPGGGFDWWGRGEPLVWLSAYGLQEFNDMAKVYPVDPGVIRRTQAWLMRQQAADGTWSKIGATHGVSIERMGDPKLLLTSYVAWSLLDSMPRGANWKKTDEHARLKKAIDFIRAEAPKAENAYILALAANALASWDAKDDSTHAALKRLLQKLEAKKQSKPEWKAISFPAQGQSLSYARDDSLTVETTALAVLAMLKHGGFTGSVNQALTYLVKSKGPGGTWGSTQATILALKALVAGAGGTPHKGTVAFTIKVNGHAAGRGEVTEANADVLQQFDLRQHVRAGRNEVALEAAGETGLMYQVVARHYEPWARAAEPKAPVLAVDVSYDRARLSTSDLLRAKATLRYNGKVPTYQVIVDLAVPPGFTADPGDFAELVGAKKVERFTLTARQVTLYLGDVKPGSVHVFEYGLRPKYPIKAKTPVSVAYEYYTPANRATSRPVALVVEDKKK